MSPPSESDLRAALRQGEDGGFQVSADTIIAEGQAVHARRVRILSATAIAAVVAAGAVGLAVARGTGGGPSHVAGPNATHGPAHSGRQPLRTTLPQAPEATPLPSRSPLPIPVAGPNAAGAAGCPSHSPHLLAPGGGSPGQFGSDQPLFAKPVATLIVCSYDPAKNTAPGRLVYNGRSAAQIVASMENAAAKTTAPTPCEPGATSTTRLLAFIAVTAAGATEPPVTATVTEPACNVQLTNGTAVRFGWTPPARLTQALKGLTPPRTVITVSNEPSGIENGTPIHS